MDTGSIIALVFGSITVLGGAITGAVYIGKLIAAIDRMNETNSELKRMFEDHENRIVALEGRHA